MTGQETFYILPFLTSSSIFLPTTSHPLEEKYIWMLLGSNPGPLALLATAFSAPWLPGNTVILARINSKV